MTTDTLNKSKRQALLDLADEWDSFVISRADGITEQAYQEFGNGARRLRAIAKPRYTFIWWGDGYFVYDGDKYIGKGDQVDPERFMFENGLAQRYDYEDAEADWGMETLTDFFKHHGKRKPSGDSY